MTLVLIFHSSQKCLSHDTRTASLLPVLGSFPFDHTKHHPRMSPEPRASPRSTKSSQFPAAHPPGMDGWLSHKKLIYSHVTYMLNPSPVCLYDSSTPSVFQVLRMQDSHSPHSHQIQWPECNSPLHQKQFWTGEALLTPVGHHEISIPSYSEYANTGMSQDRKMGDSVVGNSQWFPSKSQNTGQFPLYTLLR